MTVAESQVRRTSGEPGAVPGVVDALHGFAGELWGAARAGRGNLAVSPYSVAMALGMSLNGAGGATATEMRSVLGVEDLGRFNAGLNALAHHLEGLAGKVPHRKESIALTSADAIFAEQSTTWVTAFLDVLAREYGAGVRLVDFVGETEAARRAINAWTAAQTRDRIPEIAAPGVLDSRTRAVLVDALYLKAPWEFPFDEHATRPGAFRLADGSDVEVPMMSGAAETMALGRGEGWRSVRIPYAGSTLAMTVVLPDDLAALETRLTEGGLSELLVAGDRRPVAVRMPRFTFRFRSMLRTALSRLGMPTAFDPSAADFSGMTTGERLSISEVLHEVFVAVDENGTEAAAATAVVMRTVAAIVGPEPFVVDRPFLFVIYDVEHATPLFVGRVADPR